MWHAFNLLDGMYTEGPTWFRSCQHILFFCFISTQEEGGKFKLVTSVLLSVVPTD